MECRIGAIYLRHGKEADDDEMFVRLVTVRAKKACELFIPELCCVLLNIDRLANNYRGSKHRTFRRGSLDMAQPVNPRN